MPHVAAIGVTIMLGVLLFAASYDSFRNIQASYDRTYARTHFADLTVTGGDPEAIAAAVRNAPGVDRVATRTQADQPMTIGATKLIGRVIGTSPHRPGINEIDLQRGHLGDAANPDVVVEHHTADTFGLAVGSHLRVFDGREWHDVTISGVAQSPEYLWPARNRQDILDDPHTFAVVFAPEHLAQTLSGRSSTNQLLIEMAGNATPSDRDRVVRLLHSVGAVDIEDRGDQPSNAALQENFNGFRAMAIGFPALFLTAAAIAEYVLITRLVHTDRRVIGTMLALGARRRVVVGHYVFYGAIVAAIASLAGVLVGAVATWAYTNLYASLLDLPDTVIEHRTLTAAIGFVFGLATGAIAGLAPAVGAAHVAPAEAMRGELVKPIRIGALTRLSRRWTVLPLTARVALRSLTRNRRRTIATMVGGVLALVLILASAAMLTSVRTAVDLEFGGIQRQDATVLAAPATDGLGTQLASLRGVAVVEPATITRVTVAANGRTYPTTLTGLPAATVMHSFRTVGGDVTMLPADGVLVGAALVDKLGVHVGDDVSVVSAAGFARRVRLAGLLDEPLGTALYARSAVAQSITNSAPNAYLIRKRADADRDQLRSVVTGLPGVLAYTDTYAVRNRIEGYLVIFWVFAGSMLVLGGLLAFTVIYVTMSVNLAERTRELATLLAAGASLRRLTAVVAVENLAATLLAVPLGLAAGVGAGWLFLRSFNNDVFNLHLAVGATVLIAAVAVIAAAAVSQLPAGRLIKRIDIASVVREGGQ